MKNSIEFLCLTFMIFLNKEVFGQLDSAKLLNTNILGINHIAINVYDLNKSATFYQNVFGLQKVNQNIYRKPLKKFANLNRKSIDLIGPNANIRLIEFDDTSKTEVLPIQGPGITHICYQVPSTYPIYEKLKPNGAQIISRGNSPIDLGGYGIYYTYVRDPNQILFENEQMDKPHFQEDTWIGHVAIACLNIDKMVDFYTKILGKPPHRRSEINKENPKLDAIGNIDHIKLKGAWFRTENMVFEFWEYENPKPVAKNEDFSINKIGYNYIAFEVENIRLEYKKMKKLGFNVQNKPSKGVNRQYSVKDPEGNHLLIQEIRDQSSLKFKKKLTEK